ncbi:uncharacterized protein LOC112203561 [Rosa chinensis]|uniref:uncharacterized protein LOC112203561 n=1 Tax=Rosa chinensis TaxID=74649 RepID=UPI000D08AFCE|nr:uncharacterized protein LOC112203561 [Rosa chinensis]
MNMDILSWNCRGICNDSTKRALKDLISQNHPQIEFLCETKISRMVDFMDLHRAIGFQQYKVVLSEGNSRGLAMFWNEDVSIVPCSSSAHPIDLVIFGNLGEPQWRLTGFYGYAQPRERDRSWELLCTLRDLDSLPWVVIGEFKEILNSSEKIDGQVRAERQMRGFREALGYGDLLDLGFHGPMCTWWNSETQLHLDRVVCTPSWCNIFGHARVRHLPPRDSDHAPILLQASSSFLFLSRVRSFNSDAFNSIARSFVRVSFCPSAISIQLGCFLFSADREFASWIGAGLWPHRCASSVTGQVTVGGDWDGDRRLGRWDFNLFGFYLMTVAARRLGERKMVVTGCVAAVGD